MPREPYLEFWGGVGTVTGSKYLLRTNGMNVLIDCGLFQGHKNIRAQNWQAPPFKPKELDAVILTHAHIDHSGYLPLLVKQGFKGPVFCTVATKDLCEIMLPDSGFLQEKHAEYANEKGFSKHRPALPLYTLDDAKKSLKHFQTVDFHTSKSLTSGLHFKFLRAGHILGAAILSMDIQGRRLAFSGDLGRFNSPTLVPPDTPCDVDYLVVESTYGDSSHCHNNPETKLAKIINRAASRGGTTIIPCFAVGRTQTLLYHLHRMKAQGKISDVPIFLDSPMAINASEIFCRHPLDHKFKRAECKDIFDVATYVRTVEQSKRLTNNQFPKIILSASGMATGGRVLHHLKAYITDERNAVVFTGYQAQGTRGEALVNGVKSIKIHGQDYPVRAKIIQLNELSAHADKQEILKWLGRFNRPPKHTFITHGAPVASKALAEEIEAKLQWKVHIPKKGDSFSLS